jgi:hypothetical protein
MYKKPIEAIVKEYRYDPLPDEVRAVIICVMEARRIVACGGRRGDGADASFGAIGLDTRADHVCK